MRSAALGAACSRRAAEPPPGSSLLPSCLHVPGSPLVPALPEPLPQLLGPWAQSSAGPGGEGRQALEMWTTPRSPPKKATTCVPPGCKDHGAPVAHVRCCYQVLRHIPRVLHAVLCSFPPEQGAVRPLPLGSQCLTTPMRPAPCFIGERSIVPRERTQPSTSSCISVMWFDSFHSVHRNGWLSSAPHYRESFFENAGSPFWHSRGLGSFQFIIIRKK